MTSQLPGPREIGFPETNAPRYSGFAFPSSQQGGERAFEQQVADAYRHLGYIVHREVMVGGVQVDLVIERGPIRVPVEVIGSADPGQIDRLRRDVVRLTTLRGSDIWTGKPIIVVPAFATPATSHWARHQKDVSITTLADLLLQGAEHPIPDPDPVFETPSQDEREAQREAARAATSGGMISRLRAHDEDSSTLTPSGYEQLCQDIFRFLFDPFLFGFESQAQTSDGGNRYDFICRIASGSSFWDNLRTDFRTRAILFECKSYADPITADQIYSTERYLFSGALRTVCFLISRKGGDGSCKRAAQGAMRETGKLILVLSNLDLIEMLELEDQKSAEDLLEERIWRFIISLPR